MTEDKRVAPRFLFAEPVAYCQPDVVINGSIAGNISLTGVSLKVQGFVPVGTILELQIRLGQSPKIVWIKGQVVRVRQTLSEDCFEIGLRFVPDSNGFKAVREFIENCQFKNGPIA